MMFWKLKWRGYFYLLNYATQLILLKVNPAWKNGVILRTNIHGMLQNFVPKRTEKLAIIQETRDRNTVNKI